MSQAQTSDEAGCATRRAASDASKKRPSSGCSHETERESRSVGALACSVHALAMSCRQPSSASSSRPGVTAPHACPVLQRRDMHRLWQLVAARSKREPHSVSPRGVCHFRQAAAQRPRRVVAVVDDDGVLLKAGAPGQQQQQHLAVVTALRARLRGGQPVLELRGAAGRRARRVQVEEAVPHAIGQAVPLGFGPQVVDDALVKLARARAVGRIAQAESSTRGEAHCRRGDPQQ
mmetsp:Transcript_2905/g.9137  ORF Transcript_2905/g.9137 Transcript_2905/m.9137 type:complete len:233 (-) Transcript_2905:200-898(-)